MKKGKTPNQKKKKKSRKQINGQQKIIGKLIRREFKKEKKRKKRRMDQQINKKKKKKCKEVKKVMWRCNCVQNEALFSLSSFLSYLIKNISVGSERKNQDPTKFFILSTLQSNTHKNHSLSLSLSLSLSPNKWTLIDFCKQIKP